MNYTITTDTIITLVERKMVGERKLGWRVECMILIHKLAGLGLTDCRKMVDHLTSVADKWDEATNYVRHEPLDYDDGDFEEKLLRGRRYAKNLHDIMVVAFDRQCADMTATAATPTTEEQMHDLLMDDGIAVY